MNTKRFLIVHLLASILCFFTGCNPLVRITSPANDSIFLPGETIQFTCISFDTASIPDLYKQYYTVDSDLLPAADAGAIRSSSYLWTSSIDGTIGTVRSFARDDLSNGSHNISITVTDTGGFSAKASLRITIGNTAPTVTISAPADGYSAATGESITFEGSVFDAEDGTLVGAPLVWSSDIDGEMGKGNRIIRDDLSQGRHNITLSAKDSFFEQSSKSITITIANKLVGPTTTTAFVTSTSTTTSAPDNETATTSIPGVETSSTSTTDDSSTSSTAASTSSTTTTAASDSTWSRLDLSNKPGLRGIWGTSATSLYAVGRQGTILSYDGFEWSAVTSNTTNTYNAICGTPDGTTLYASGDSGTLLKYSGSWSQLALPQSLSSDLNAIVVSDSGTPVAVGDNRIFVTLMGGQYVVTTIDAAVADGMDARALLALSETELIAVGTNGHIVKGEIVPAGITWSSMHDGADSLTFNGIWGVSATEIYAVGADGGSGVIYYYDGFDWSLQSSYKYEDFPIAYLHDIWGSSADDIYAVGYAITISPTRITGFILHYDGTAWSSMDVSADDVQFYGIWGTDASQIYAVGEKSSSNEGAMYQFTP
ncbi:WD40/YVTN/BNR-like repeat-containing protein [Thermodesulfobacteriota bacterium]